MSDIGTAVSGPGAAEAWTDRGQNQIIVVSQQFFCFHRFGMVLVPVRAHSDSPIPPQTAANQ